MFRNPIIRLSISLVLLTASVLLLADLLGLVPREQDTFLDARKKVCESLAVQVSLAVQLDDPAAVESITKQLVDRNEDILSAAVRADSGKIVAEAGDHSRNWIVSSTGMSTSTHANVPIFQGDQPWGSVEVRFTPLYSTTILGLPITPLFKLLAFVAICGFASHFFLLKRALQHLDPSAVVPARVKYALDVLAEGVALMDERGRIVLANATFCQKMEQPLSALLGRQISDLPWHLPVSEGKPIDPPWLKPGPRAESGLGTPISIKGPSGDFRTFMVKASPILDARGKLRGVLATFDDMTDLERKSKELQETVQMLELAQDQLQQKNEELQSTNKIIEAKVAQRTHELYKSMRAAEAASEAKAAFLANMSHEIRTPMQGILSYAEFGITKIGRAPREKLLGYFSEIKESGSNLLALLNDVLQLSKSGAGKMTYDMRQCDLSAVLESTAGEFQGLLQEKDLSLRLPSPSFDTSATFDQFRMAQVLRNLLSNAVKYTQSGRSIDVSISETTLNLAGERVSSLKLSVADRGVGIPDEELEHIFDPFAQSKRTDSGAGGIGLGLAICREIITAHHGWIRASHRDGGGSIFAFAIPCVQVRESVPA